MNNNQTRKLTIAIFVPNVNLFVQSCIVSETNGSTQILLSFGPVDNEILVRSTYLDPMLLA